MVYEDALNNLKDGYSIAREDWAGRVTLLKAYTIQLQVMLVDESNKVIGATTAPIRVAQSFMYIAADNTAVAGWAPAAADQLAEDWFVIDDSMLVEFPDEEDEVPETTH